MKHLPSLPGYAVLGVVLVCCWTGFQPSARAAKTYEMGHFTLELPAAWLEVDPARIESHLPGGSSPLPGGHAAWSDVDYAFYRKAGEDRKEMPVLAISVHITRPFTKQELESSSDYTISEYPQSPQSLAEFLSTDIKVGKLAYDAKRNMAWHRTENRAEDGRIFLGLTGFIPSPEGFITATLVAPRSDFQQHGIEFTSAILAVTPPAMSPNQPHWLMRTVDFLMKTPFGKLLLAAIVATAIFVLMVVAVRVIEKIRIPSSP